MQDLKGEIKLWNLSLLFFCALMTRVHSHNSEDDSGELSFFLENAAKSKDCFFKR